MESTESDQGRTRGFKIQVQALLNIGTGRAKHTNHWIGPNFGPSSLKLSTSTLMKWDSLPKYSFSQNWNWDSLPKWNGISKRSPFRQFCNFCFYLVSLFFFFFFETCLVSLCLSRTVARSLWLSSLSLSLSLFSLALALALAISHCGSFSLVRLSLSKNPFLHSIAD